MSLFARLVGATLCCAALASPLSALADAAPIDLANAGACKLDRIREIVAGARAHTSDVAEQNQLIVENTADWLPDYNVFASAPETASLLAAANDAVAAGKLSGAACRQLLPFAAVAASAEAVSQAGGAVSAGAVLTSCETGTGLCQPAATAGVLEQCQFKTFSLPLQSSC